MKIKSISHAGLTVSDFDRAVRWYHENFGFLLVSEKRLGKPETKELYPLYGVEGAEVRLGFLRAPGGTVLEIFSFSPAAGAKQVAWNAPGFTHVAFDVSGAAGWKARLEAAGAGFVTGVNATDGTEWAFLRDPDGNLVELIDLKALRPVVKIAGGLVGWLLKKGKFSPTYAAGGKR